MKTPWDDDSAYIIRNSNDPNIGNGKFRSTIEITPNLQYFEDEFAAALNECVDFGLYTETLSSTDEANRILVPIAGEVPLELSLECLIVKNACNHDQQFISVNVLRKHCHDLLHACVLRCTDFLSCIDHLRKSYDQNHVYRIRLERIPEVVDDPNNLDDDLSRMKGELEEIESMNRSNEMGVIRFEIGKILQKYKTELIDCIGKLSFRLCFVYMFNYLVFLAYEQWGESGSNNFVPYFLVFLSTNSPLA